MKDTVILKKGFRKEDKVFFSFDHAVIIAVSILLLSPFGWSLLLNLSGNYVPEPIIVCVILYILLSKGDMARALKKSLSGKYFLLSMLFLFAMFLIGISLHGDFVAAYSDFRGLSFFIIFFLVSFHDDSETILLRLSTISEIFLISSLASIIAYLVLPGNGTVKNVYPIFFPVYCIVYSSIIARPGFKKDAVVYSSIAMILFMAVTSFYRLYYFIAIVFSVGPVLISVYKIFFQKSRVYEKVTTVIFAIIAIFVTTSIGFQYFIIDYLSSSQDRYGQSIGKLMDVANALAGGDSQGDESRALYYQTIWENFFAFCIPSGLGQKVLEGNWGSLWSTARLVGDAFSSKDGGFIYMVTHFGIIITIIVLYKTTKSVVAQFFSKSGMKFILGLLFVCLAFTYSVTAAMFVQVAFAAGFAACCGIVISWNRYVCGGGSQRAAD